MSETIIGSKVQAWLDVMPTEAPDRLFDAVMSVTAEVGQDRPRLRWPGLVFVHRRLLLLAVVALLLVATAVALLLVAGQTKPGPHTYVNEIVTAEPLAASRAHPVLVRLADGRVLVIGGSDTDPVAEVLDPGTGAHVPVFEPTGGAALRDTYAGALLGDGRVFLLAPGEAWVFDQVTASFAPLPGMTTVRDGAAMVVLRDGRVFISGGYAPGDEGNSLASAELFDPTTGGFAAVPGVMAYGRERPRMLALPDGSALILSGLTRIDGGRIGNSQVEVFDPETGEIHLVSSAAPQASLPVALPDGRIALFDAALPFQVTGNMTMLDLASRTVAPSQPLPYGVNAAELLADGRILITGAEGNGQTAGIFDPASASLVEAPNLLAWSPSAVGLADGRVLFAGGFSEPEPAKYGLEPPALPPAVPTVELFQ